MAFSEAKAHGVKTTGTAEPSEIETRIASRPGRSSPPVFPASGLSTPAVGRWKSAHRGLLLVASIVLVMAGRGQHFFYDEWAFVGGKRDALPFLDRYLLPHNEHWSTLPLMVYRSLGATVGIASYWPYLGLLLVLHLGVTHVLWRLMLATGTKPIVATALAAVFSVLGAGAEDLVWAFQIGFVGSTLLGLTAVYLAVTGSVGRRKTAVLTCLTIAGLATSGVGLAYLIVVPLVLARRHWRYGITVFSLSILAYAVWYTTYGHSLTHTPTASAGLPLIVVAMVTVGLASALSGYFGFENNIVSLLVVGVPTLAGLTVACRGWLADRTLVGRTLFAMTTGAIAFYVAAGLARGGLGLGAALASRYVYVAIALLLPAIAMLISQGTDRHPGLIRVVVPLVIAMTASNAFKLSTFADEVRQNNNDSRRVLEAASELVGSNSPIFGDQLPEPFLAPDLTTADLASRHLDPAIEDADPRPANRLTASLNLQIQVSRDGGTVATSTCQATPEQRITVMASRRTAPSFLLSADALVTFTLHAVGLRSDQRVIALTKGIYMVKSLRDAGELTIGADPQVSTLAKCSTIDSAP
jgi:hypothetical protein